MELEYLKLIQEENINDNDLPKEIKNKIKGLKMMVGRKNPSAAVHQNIIKNDVIICDLITDWLEDGLPNDDEPPVETPPVETPPVETPPVNFQPPTPPVEPPVNTGLSVEEMEVKIRENLIGNRIKGSILKEIIGKKPSPNQIVGSLRLTKIFLSDDYRL